LKTLCALAALLAAGAAAAAALDPGAYLLTDESAKKYVAVTQKLSALGAVPRVGGKSAPPEPAEVKRMLDQDPKARAVLQAEGMTSDEYALFMSTAMQAGMAASMEQAGMSAAGHPMTAKVPKQNVAFMRANMDLFERAMRPPEPSGPASGLKAPAALASSVLSEVPPLTAAFPKAHAVR
jgi:hypothetical protein